MTRIRALLIDDETAFTAPLGIRPVKRGLEVQAVDSLSKEVAALAEDLLSVVKLDIKMAAMGAFDTS